MVEVGKFKLGLFVVGTVTLFVVVLFLLGLSEMFAPKGNLVTFFSESVQGLDVGSEVKYKGVPIGKVSAIYIDTKDKQIRVDMAVDLKNFTVSKQSDSMMSVSRFYDFCKVERDQGLRCRLNYSGITGLKYIELDYYAQPDPGAAKQYNKFEEIPGAFFIPSSPSTLNNIMEKLNTSLDHIASIDFEGISERIIGGLSEISTLLSTPELKESVVRLGTITADMEKITGALADNLTPERTDQLMADLETSLREFQRLTSELSAQVGAAQIADTSLSVRSSAVAISDFRRELTVTISKLNYTLDAIARFFDYVEEDPNSLIMGKRTPELKLKSE